MRPCKLPAAAPGNNVLHGIHHGACADAYHRSARLGGGVDHPRGNAERHRRIYADTAGDVAHVQHGFLRAGSFLRRTDGESLSAPGALRRYKHCGGASGAHGGGAAVRVGLRLCLRRLGARFPLAGQDAFHQRRRHIHAGTRCRGRRLYLLRHMVRLPHRLLHRGACACRTRAYHSPQETHGACRGRCGRELAQTRVQILHGHRRGADLCVRRVLLVL